MTGPTTRLVHVRMPAIPKSGLIATARQRHYRPMGQDFTIRSVRQGGDSQLVADLHVRGYAEYGDRFANQHFVDHVGASVEEAGLDAPGTRSRVWFIERDGEAIGCTAMIDRGTEGQLRWVILLPEARGHGLGRKLVELALDHARASGWRSVYLETTDGLDASMALYRKLGFEVERMDEDPDKQPYGAFILMRLKF